MRTGNEVLLTSPDLIQKLKGKSIALFSHAAAVNQNLKTSFEEYLNHPGLSLKVIFSPQHGFEGTEQANMITSPHGKKSNIPLFSLYSKNTRNLTREMKDCFDVLLVDLQDVGCRIYTYLTSLILILEDLAGTDKDIWILDRPNPLGSRVEGNLLDSELQSFVGKLPIPIRHGMTLGELANWFKNEKNLPLNLKIIRMKNYNPKQGWDHSRHWIWPSPNLPSLLSTACYPGSALLEGTMVSEGRGTTLPFQVFGMPKMHAEAVKKRMREIAPDFIKGIHIRNMKFKPTFDKFKNEVCSGFQIHIIKPSEFQPYRLICLFLKALIEIHPNLNWKLPPPYEYEAKKLPLDILSGNTFIKNWIADSAQKAKDLEDFLKNDEDMWSKCQKDISLYYTNRF